MNEILVRFDKMVIERMILLCVGQGHVINAEKDCE